jgi:hydroxymethylbilane synthase
VQARYVADSLKILHPLKKIEIIPVLTSGDRTMAPLADIGGKALFTKELQEALLSGHIDAAVHSLKDVEAHNLPSLTFAAFLPRSDARDVLITRSDVDMAAPGVKLGTCSPRRRAQALMHLGGVEVVDMRGNVGTRLERVKSGVVDATILAAAGLSRLGIGDACAFEQQYPTLRMTPLDVHKFVPAAGQGILVVETHVDKAPLFAQLNDPLTSCIAHIERAFAAYFGGNCRTALGSFVEPQADGNFILHAFFENNYASLDLGSDLSQFDVRALGPLQTALNGARRNCA